MIERLVFGCGHLTGGAAQRTVHGLVARCLDAGIRRFDIAPLYGLGTAEAALGMALRRDGREALINTKVGLPRPRFGILKSYLRAAKRLLSHPHTAPGMTPPRSNDDRLPRGRFDLGEMASSLAGTLRSLQLSSVETLFLQEAYADNISPAALAFLQDAQTRGLTRDIGVANGAMFDATLATLMPPGFVLQSAAPPEFFDGKARELPERLVFHTVIKSYRWRCSIDGALNRAIESTCCRFKLMLGDNPGAEVALGYLLLAAAAPKAMLVYATTAPSRLDAFLRSMDAVSRENAAAEIASHASALHRKLHGQAS